LHLCHRARVAASVASVARHSQSLHLSPKRSVSVNVDRTSARKLVTHLAADVVDVLVLVTNLASLRHHRRCDHLNCCTKAALYLMCWK